MFIARPYTVTESDLLSSSIAEDDHDEYDPGTTYSLETRVISLATHSVYQSLQDDNVGNDPTVDNSVFWVRVGATNRWKFFDKLLNDRATSPNQIVLSFTCSSIVDVMGFFGVLASSIRVKATSAVEGVVYDRTENLVDYTGIIDWSEHLFLPDEQDVERLFDGIPQYLDLTFEVTITGSDPVEVGQIVPGQQIELGETMFGTSVEFRSYTTIEDDQFGNKKIIPRDYAQDVTFLFSYISENARNIQRQIVRQVHEPTMFYAFIGSEKYATVVFGLPKPMRLELQTSNKSTASLRVEGYTQ